MLPNPCASAKRRPTHAIRIIVAVERGGLVVMVVVVLVLVNIFPVVVYFFLPFRDDDDDNGVLPLDSSFTIMDASSITTTSINVMKNPYWKPSRRNIRSCNAS